MVPPAMHAATYMQLVHNDGVLRLSQRAVIDTFDSFIFTFAVGHRDRTFLGSPPGL